MYLTVIIVVDLFGRVFPTAHMFSMDLTSGRADNHELQHFYLTDAIWIISTLRLSDTTQVETQIGRLAKSKMPILIISRNCEHQRMLSSLP